jgi:hypothetical protein
LSDHPEPNRTFSITLTSTPGYFAMLDEVSGRLGVDWGTTSLRAIALLKTAMDARDEGKRVAILDDSDNSEQEIEW